MEFIDFERFSDNDLKNKLRELSVKTRFSYSYLLQEVRRAHLENKVILIVDVDHFIDIDRNVLAREGEGAIVAFVEKFAPRPEGVLSLEEIDG